MLLPAYQSFKKNAANVSKWGVEVAKQKPWLMVLENLCANDLGVRTTQHAKTVLIQAKKVNSKAAKRLGYESESNGELTFHARVGHLKDVLQATKDFRGQALLSAKGGPIDPATLEKSITLVKTPFQALVKDFNPAFPQHWALDWDMHATSCDMI